MMMQLNGFPSVNSMIRSLNPVQPENLECMNMNLSGKLVFMSSACLLTEGSLSNAMTLQFLNASNIGVGLKCTQQCRCVSSRSKCGIAKQRGSPWGANAMVHAKSEELVQKD